MKNAITDDMTRTGYIGKELDAESGLGDHGVRKYEYETGRFTSTDPLWEKKYGLTPYQYASDNPITALDRNSLEWFILGNKEHGLDDVKGFVGIEYGSRILMGDDGKVTLDLEGYESGTSKELDLIIDLVESEKKFGFESFDRTSSVFESSTSNIINKSNKVYSPEYEGDGTEDSYKGPGYPAPEGFDGFVGFGNKENYYLNETDASSDSNEQSKVLMGHELQENYFRSVLNMYYEPAHARANDTFWGGSDSNPIIPKRK